MKLEIETELKAIELKHSVRILFACEAGSRAWGFASPDSDYKIRFIYTQPKEHQLSMRERREMIELPMNETMDIYGWDIRKALHLFRSEAPLYEWLQSPIVYKEVTGFAGELRRLMPAYFPLGSAYSHYHLIANKIFLHDLTGTPVKLKKYFDGLQPALACRWILEKKTVPPMEFQQLRKLVAENDWQEAVDELLQQKLRGPEEATIAPLPILRYWYDPTLEEFKAQLEALAGLTKGGDQLDELFRKYSFA